MLQQSGIWLINSEIEPIIDVLSEEINQSRISSRKPFLVVVSNFDQVMKFSMLKIDQMVYFMTKDRDFIYEAYSVNEKTIVQEVAYFDRFWRWTTSSDYLARRKNLHGLTLKVMTEAKPPFINFKTDYKSKAANSTSIPFTYKVNKTAEKPVNFLIKICFRWIEWHMVCLWRL